MFLWYWYLCVSFTWKGACGVYGAVLAQFCVYGAVLSQVVRDLGC